MPDESLTTDRPTAPTTAIAEYSPTACALAELRQRLANVVYDVRTTAGMDAARKDRRELVKLRTALEAKRQELKAPALERSRLIDAEAKRITAEILALEEPVDAQIIAEETRKATEKAAREQAERERVNAIRARIDEIKRRPVAALKLDAAGVQAMMDEHSSEVADAQAWLAPFGEFGDEAATAHAAALEFLIDLRNDKLAAEAEAARLAEAAAELQRQQDAEAERQRAAREEQARKDAEAAAERKRLDDEARARREAEEAEARRQIEEQDRLAREAREREEAAARERMQREENEARERREREEQAAAAARAERERIERQEADRIEAARVAEERRLAAEREAAEAAEREARDAHMREVVMALDALRADPRVEAFAELATTYKLAPTGIASIEALAALCGCYAGALGLLDREAA